MYFILPVSVNECNLREAYTIAPREVRQMGNDYVRRELMTYGKHLDSRKKSTGCDALSIDLLHSGSLISAYKMYL
jgi:hypothetical protein